ncbi:hypothetical protein [Rubellicoccus peritrichatus]|uniref:Right handed beta helix domain-containing protein n=1 Tax=Rubellicoccus peritrichatus TaxID=3080537 RepID=A0AAQ3LI65_9BACT|nr:hypothetical protein [Puniceicoccus sp. CR14]WOO42529.1 hypothetical protein RZN69_05460 [Puniceicoccus sp. CR14]
MIKNKYLTRLISRYNRSTLGIAFALVSASGLTAATYSEDFNDGLAQNWTNGSTWTVNGSKYSQSSTSGVKNDYYTGFTGGDGVEFEAKVKLLGNGDRAGILFRKQDGLNTYYFLRIRTNSLQFWKCINGSASQVGAWTYFSHSVGTYYTLKVKIIGNDYEIYRNGNLVDTRTDTAITGDGQVGLYCNVSTAEFDDVVLTYPDTGITTYDEDFNDGLAQTWTGGTTWSVSGNKYGQSSTFGVKNSYYTGFIAGDGLEFEAKVKLLGNGDRAGILFRKLDNENTYYFLRIRNTSLQFWKCINGTVSQVGAWTYLSHAIGTYYTLGVKILGNSYEIYRDGVLVDTRTDNSITSDGQIGLYCNEATADFDDVSATYPSGEYGAGIAYAPSYAKPLYNASTDIPSDALDASNYSTIADWIAAMNSQGKAGKIGSGVYLITPGPASRLELQQSIYGYGATKPIFRWDDPTKVEGGFLYLGASNITVQNVRFEGFPMPLAYHSNWTYLSGYYLSNRFNSQMLSGSNFNSGLGIPYNSDISNINILDCDFVDCAVGMAMITNEDYRLSNMHVARNYVSGGSGFISYIGNKFDHFYFYQNYIENMDQRQTGKRGGKIIGTILWLGTDLLANHANNQVVRVENNECYNVVSAFTYSKHNSSVFADVRCCDDVSISWNILVDLESLNGHSDANAIYSKSFDLLIEGNHIENCGSNTVNPSDNSTFNGSEGGCITLKGGCSPTLVRNNTFIAGTKTMGPMVLLAHNDVTLTDCTFADWQYTGTYYKRRAMIRSFSSGSTPVYTISDIDITNCGQAGTNVAYFYENNGEGESDCIDLTINFDDNRRNVIRMKNNNGKNNIINCYNELGETLTRVWP